MPNLDGGHYFFSAIVPVRNTGIVEHEGMKSSPIHMVREALETLPTALQSPASEKIGIASPFSRSLRTHFVRIVVLDDPFYNGRDHGDALVAAIKGTNLLEEQPVDRLACPYLLVMIDFDPIDPAGEGEPRAYFEELWQLMPEELSAVFRYCYTFDKVADGRSFADFILACQVETTMPFNDYWVGAPPLPSLSTKLLAAIPIAGLVVPLLIAWWRHWPWWHGLLLGLGLALIGVAADYWIVMRRGARPFPSAPNSTLRDVLKALYLQQAFARFAAKHQDSDPAALGAAFRGFLGKHRPADLGAPTQPPGVIRCKFPKGAA